MRGLLSERGNLGGMIEFAIETLSLLPYLFVTYLVLEALEAHASGALEGFLGRSRAIGPFIGALAGAIPQCGISAAAASFYAGGVISVGTLAAVFFSTSDELIPVLIAAPGFPGTTLVKIVGLKVAAAVIAGFVINGVLVVFRCFRRPVDVAELCAHSRCHCSSHRGILIPALIHTAEIFFFIVIISGIVELTMHFYGEHALDSLRLNTPLVGEFAAGALGLIPNCAISVVGAKLYLSGAMSAGALMASSFTGSGVGLLVLFRTNRDWRENLAILATVYFVGVLLGWLTGFLL